MPSQTSTVIDDDTMLRILADTVFLSRAEPGKLFKVKRTKANMTTDWSAVKSFMPTLAEIFDITGGQQLTHIQFVRQIDLFLRKQTPPQNLEFSRHR